MGKGQSLLVKSVGPRLDWEGAGVGLGKGSEPGEDILESSEGGREGGWGGPTSQREEPTRQRMFQGRSFCRQTLRCGPSCASVTQGRLSQSGA